MAELNIQTNGWPTTARTIDLAVKEVHAKFRVDLPQTAVEWADENFYLSAESSGTVGRWVTLPYQVAMLNAMGSPDIQRINVFKAARVGYTKMLMAAMGYFLVKKKRSFCLWQPTDSDRNEFVKDEIETAIRDVPVWKNSFPAYGKKSSDNTIERKAFLGSTLWLKGATSAKNFRRITPDIVGLDEVDAMPLDIDGEGTAEALSWKRAEVSSFRKQIIGSSPKESGSSQIEAAASRAKARLRFQVKCPECGGFAPIEFGGRDCKHGLTWEKGKPETVLNYCRECGVGWPNSKLYDASKAGFWLDDATGYSTSDGIVWRLNGEPCSAPRHVAFHVWSAYSPYASWVEIAEEWLAAQGDPLALKSFVNTTLGETWEATAGEQVKPAQLKSRARDEMPDDICVVTCGVDTQGDRWEAQWIGWNASGDAAVLRHEIIAGEPDRLSEWEERLWPKLQTPLVVHGKEFVAEAFGVDTGGLSTQTAYDFCARYQDEHVLALKGVTGDKPIIPMAPSSNWRKVGLNGWNVGVNAAKDVIMTMVAREEGAGRLLFPAGVDLPPDYFDQLLSEVRVLKTTRGKRTYIYQKRSRSARNEALDLTVYGLAGLKWLQVHQRLDLVERASQEDNTEADYSALWG